MIDLVVPEVVHGTAKASHCDIVIAAVARWTVVLPLRWQSHLST